MSEVKFKLAAGTNVGLYRQNNEDNFIGCPDLADGQWLIPQNEDFEALGPYGALLVVADGMGGMNAGEVASALAVETIQQLFTSETIAQIVEDEKAIQDFMIHVVKTADLNILNRSNNDSSTQGMGTTVVMAWVLGKRAYVCWCGDSRCYVLNRHHGLMCLSKDHSFVQELVDRGELEPQYASEHPLSNVITRCLGNEEKRAEPEIRIYELYDGDTLMLCSDGLSALCQDELIASVMQEYGDNPMECRNELISAALSKGGHDNVTVALCHIGMPDDAVEEEQPAADGNEDGEQKDAPSDDNSPETDQTDEKKATTETKDTKSEELSATLRVKPQKKRRWLWWSVTCLVLVLAAVAYYVYYPDHARQHIESISELYEELMKTVNTNIQKLK